MQPQAPKSESRQPCVHADAGGQQWELKSELQHTGVSPLQRMLDDRWEHSLLSLQHEPRLPEKGEHVQFVAATTAPETAAKKWRRPNGASGASTGGRNNLPGIERQQTQQT